jgi:hypothetical protein
MGLDAVLIHEMEMNTPAEVHTEETCHILGQKCAGSAQTRNGYYCVISIRPSSWTHEGIEGIDRVQRAIEGPLPHRGVQSGLWRSKRRWPSNSSRITATSSAIPNSRSSSTDGRLKGRAPTVEGRPCLLLVALSTFVPLLEK